MRNTMAYYKVTMKQTWEWEVLVHANDAEDAVCATEFAEWGEPVSDGEEVVSVVELEEKKDE
jgi:hypothetical protein